MNTTGDRIRELRIQQKLTLDDVAQYLGVGRQAVYKYEHGTVTNIPLDNIEKMAKLFGVTNFSVSLLGIYLVGLLKTRMSSTMPP